MADSAKSSKLLAAVGGRIAERREAVGLMQVELAAKLGITPGLVSHYERGTRTPPTAMLTRIAGVLGEEVKPFVAGTDAEPRFVERPTVLLCTNVDCPAAEWHAWSESQTKESERRASFPLYDEAGERRHFCSGCGHELQERCACGRAFQEGEDFCARCGRPVRRHACERCRKPLRREVVGYDPEYGTLLNHLYQTQPDGSAVCKQCQSTQTVEPSLPVSAGPAPRIRRTKP